MALTILLFLKFEKRCGQNCRPRRWRQAATDRLHGRDQVRSQRLLKLRSVTVSIGNPYSKTHFPMTNSSDIAHEVSLDHCLEGGETTCSSGTISGYLTPGTFQQYCLSPAIYVTPMPDDIDLGGAAPLMCGGISVYAGLKRAKVRHGQWVVISGAGGGLGHLAIQYAKVLGARVLALDAGSKEEFCLGFKADAFIDFSKYDTDDQLAAAVKAVTKESAKIVLMCSSSNRAYSQAISFLGFRGTLVCLGVPEGPQLPIAGAKVADLIGLELTIFGGLLFKASIPASLPQHALPPFLVMGRGLTSKYPQRTNQEIELKQRNVWTLQRGD